VPLEQDTLQEPVLVYSPPEPVANTVDSRADLIQKPPGTPAGFPVAEAFSEQRAELDGPFAECLVTDLDAALVQQFLNVSVTQRKAVVQQHGILDDGHGKTVAVRFRVSHGESAYPEPIKATQPTEPIFHIKWAAAPELLR
jgi:hypothetical protein